MRYPTEVNLVGDAADTLRALLPLLRRKEDRSWREDIERSVDRWWRILDDRAHQRAHPINPQLVFHELSDRLPDRAILTADSGCTTPTAGRTPSSSCACSTTATSTRSPGSSG
jgi:pyruvate dehydrogenase (quinone)